MILQITAKCVIQNAALPKPLWGEVGWGWIESQVEGGGSLGGVARSSGDHLSAVKLTVRKALFWTVVLTVRKALLRTVVSGQIRFDSIVAVRAVTSTILVSLHV